MTFSQLNAYFCDLKPLAARMLLCLGIYAAEKNKVTGSDVPHLSYYNSSHQ